MSRGRAGVRAPRSARRLRGLSLVEALVALLVLSIGMLGIAGLFVHSVRSSRTALLRTQAVNLVADMSDRIRANLSAGPAYDLAAYGGAPSVHGCAPSDAAGSGGNCSIEELAEDDLARWQQLVRRTLPAIGGEPPATEVDYIAPATATEPARFRVAVGWGEPGDTPAEPAGMQSFRYESSVVALPRPPI